MIIPYQELSGEVLNAIIEDWLTRQTQELLSVSNTKAELIADVKNQLKSNYMVVTWDDESQTVNLMERGVAEQSVKPYWPESGESE